jgi:hypothetical protein
MASSKFKLNKSKLIQISFLLLAFLLIFFTYFLNLKKKQPSTLDQIKTIEPDGQKEDVVNRFIEVEYAGIGMRGNRFVLRGETAWFEVERPNLIKMEQVKCVFYLKNGEAIVTSNFAIYNNVTDDMEFEENVKIKFLENVLFSEKASFLNYQNKLLIEGNVKGSSPQGTLSADVIQIFDLDGSGKLKISMYNDEKVNIKVNF